LSVSSKARDLIQREREFTSLGFKLYPSYLKRGKGSGLEDIDSHKLVDFASGAAVCNVGICNQEVVDAVKKQADELIYTAMAPNETVIMLAEKLARLAPGSFKKRVYFTLTGSDAMDTAFKLARWYSKKPRVIAFYGGFYGITMGSLSLTALKKEMQERFFPLVPGVTHVPYPYCYRCPFGLEYPECGLYCLDYIKSPVLETTTPAKEVGAVVVECVQGDGGVVVPPGDYLPKLKRLCEDYGFLFVDDEVATGLGRTGKVWAADHWNIEPDVVAVAKPLGSGVPIAAVISKAEVMEWGTTGWAFTHSGHSLGVAAALKTIEIIERDRLPEKAAKMGEYLLKRCRELQSRHEIIGDVRGLGLMVGVELVKDRKTKEPAKEESVKACYRAYQKGVLTWFDGVYSNVFRLMPALTISEEEVDKGMECLDEALKDVEAGKVPFPSF
jgi:4-aminobutyrate aminotransferase